jgi:kynurenine 3-monooxygenase
MKKQIDVMGSGLIGSLVSIYLAKRGHEVNLFERRVDMRKNRISAGRSINLALSDRGFRGLAGAGLQDAIREISIPMYGRQIHHMDGSQSFQPYGKEGQAIYSVSRGGINMRLMELADQYPNIKIHFEHRCVEVDPKSAKAKVLNEASGEVLERTPDIVIGADGAFSPVRNSLQTKTDRFDYSQTYIEHGYKELVITPDADGGFQMEKTALHIWPRKSFMLIALPNLDGSFTCTLFLPFEGEVSFAKLNTDQEITAFMQEYFADALPMMPSYLEDWHANPTSSLSIVRCNPWNYKDKVCLIGDAAHAIVPFYGQGMNCGFEDCVVLDELLETLGDDNWIEVFNNFSRLRKPNGDAVAQLALDNFIEMRDKTGDPKFLLRKQIESRISKENPSFLSLYAQVTFSPHISYAQAYQAGQRHDHYLNELASIEQVMDKWNTSEVQSIIRELLSAE